MNEPRDSPARQKQFLAICVLGAGVFLNTFINSGGFHSVIIDESTFPGGEYVYRLITKDVSTSEGNLRCLASDLEMHADEDVGDFMYSIFLDTPAHVPSGKTRYFSGALTQKDGKKMKSKLIESQKNPPLNDCVRGDYEIVRIPKVKAGVAQFPFTNGFVSALILTHKILPAMTKYATQHGTEGNHPVTITTCSVQQRMCSHYVPLEKNDVFLLGRPDMTSYVKSMKEVEESKKREKDDYYQNVWKGIKSLSPL